DPFLSLVSYDLSHGTVISDTGWFEWSAGYAPPGIPVTLTKTLHVDEPGFYTMPITETVAFSPEGLVEPMERTTELVELLEGGDAPSSHYHGGPIPPMETYPGSGVSAQYPVVWDWDGTLGAGPVTGYYGFCHHSPGTAYLGSPPSYELDADLLPDQDQATNIDPASNTPDRDLSDDGVTFPGPLPHCVPVNVLFTGHNSSGATLYLNAWADWNRDGDWEDGSLCSCGDHEWAIQDYAISTSTFNASIPITPCHTCDPTEPVWIRVTLSEVALAPLEEPWIYGGQPNPAPNGCFELGETEDYLLSQNVAYVPLVTKRY
ncbi:MAG TPA: GEVED domain-containing protein, partial [Anaerolineae bacterium]|nr:GEVED domain-containing protein [Anaerolineae bacterium]